MRLLLTLGAIGSLVACRNPCQDLCKEMISYAEDCGYTVPGDQLDACVADHRRRELEEGQRAICLENGEALRTEWSCEENARFIGLEVGSGDTGS